MASANTVRCTCSADGESAMSAKSTAAAVNVDSQPARVVIGCLVGLASTAAAAATQAPPTPARAAAAR